MANLVTNRFIECHDLLKTEGVVKSSRQFALAIGTLPQSLNGVLKGSRDATVKNLMSIVEVYNISESFLLSGDGPMFKQEEEEKVEIIAPKEDRIVYMPVPAHAGYMDQFQETITEDDISRFSIPGYQDMYGEHRCFDVEGDSMEPTLFAGDMIVCSRVPSSNNYNCIKDKYVHVIVTLTDIRVKRIVNNITKNGTITLMSDNDYYRPTEVHANEIKEIWRVNLKLSSLLPDPQNNAVQDQVKSLEATIKLLQGSIEKLAKKN